MARRCELLSDKGVMYGNKVSHANNKTRRRFLPNLLNCTIISEKLGQNFKMRISRKAQRTVEFKGGFDDFLLNTKNSKLTEEALRIKRKLLKLIDPSALAPKKEPKAAASKESPRALKVKKAVAEKPAAKKATAEKAPAKKASAKIAPAKAAPAKAEGSEKSAAKKAPAKETSTKKPAAKKAKSEE